MYFKEWLRTQPYGTASRGSRETRLSLTTIFRAARGEPLVKHDVAKRISDATGGAVTIEELCAPRSPSSEPPPAQGDAA